MTDLKSSNQQQRVPSFKVSWHRKKAQRIIITMITIYVIFIALICVVKGFLPRSSHKIFNKHICLLCAPITEDHGSAIENNQEEVEITTSPTIVKLENKLSLLSQTLSSLREEKALLETELNTLDNEYGSEITRIKKEFSRMKERFYEESRDINDKSKVDALKEVLPITDNYYRARQLFTQTPIESEGETKILATYDDIFQSFSKVIEGFGVTRIEALGQPFDFNFHEVRYFYNDASND